ncbi:MAG: flagellar export protein FliJ [Sporolactobacillus sp.]|nr:flagellar export protein FliJ [Sporolactobacillus sp.]
MPFEFRLERIRKIAESEKDHLESQYREACSRLEDVGYRLIDLFKQKEATQTELEGRMKRSITIDSMKLILFDVEKMDRVIEKLSIRYHQEKRRVEMLREQLKEKNIEVKKYDHVKEKQWKNYRGELKKLEMDRMDEIAAVRAASKMRRG